MTRTHAQIIKSAGGAHAVAAKLHADLGGELATLQSRVRGWVLQSSIPGEYWQTLAGLEVATLDELAVAAERRRLGRNTQQGVAA